MNLATRRVGWWPAVLLLVLLGVVWAEDPTPEQAQADADKLVELDKQFREKLQQYTGGVLVHETDEPGMLRKADELLALLKVADAEIVPVVQPVLADCVARYGENEMLVSNKFFDYKLPNRDEAASAFGRLLKGVTNVSKSRKTSAQYLVDYVKSMPQITFFVGDKRLQIAEGWKKLLLAAVAIDPNSQEAYAQLAAIDQVIALAAKSLETEANTTTWPGHVADFAGPGTTAGLAKAAIEYFRTERTWGGSDRKITILNVAVRGPWQIAETNLFGQVIQWRLPICLAVTTPEYKAKNLARIYDLSILAKVGAPGAAPKEPPFDGFWVGDSKFIRPAKVPAP